MLNRSFDLSSRKEKSFLNLIVFMISPFLAILNLIINYSKIYNKRALIVLISGFIGFSYFITPTKDINRYISFFVNYNESFSSFLSGIGNRFTEDKGSVDFYLDIISLILRNFTDNVNVFLLTLGLVFGLFYSNYIVFILNSVKRNNVLCGFFIFSFIIAINPSLAINSRFYVASACSILGFYNFFLKGKSSSLLLVALSLIIHFGTLPFIIIYLLVYLTRNKPIIAIIITCLSLTISGLNFSSYSSYFSGLGLSALEYKVTSYTSERSQERFETRFGEESTWFLKFRSRTFFTSAFLLLIYFYRVKFKEFDLFGKRLFILAMFCIAFWNLINSFPMIYRYEPGLVVMISSYFVYLNGSFNLNYRQKKYQYFLLPFLALYPIISFRTFLDALPIHFLVSNPFTEAFMESSKNIYNFFIS